MPEDGAPQRDPLPPRHYVAGSSAETNLATSVTAYLLAGPSAFGGLGWLADQWLGTSFLIVVGLLLGMGLALYTVWLRYG